MLHKKQLRATVQTIDGELAQLARLPAGAIPPSRITDLFESWDTSSASLLSVRRQAVVGAHDAAVR